MFVPKNLVLTFLLLDIGYGFFYLVSLAYNLYADVLVVLFLEYSSETIYFRFVVLCCVDKVSGNGT